MNWFLGQHVDDTPRSCFPVLVLYKLAYEPRTIIARVPRVLRELTDAPLVNT